MRRTLNNRGGFRGVGGADGVRDFGKKEEEGKEAHMRVQSELKRRKAIK